MRKVTLFIASSLDNFIAREDGGIDWLFVDGDYGYKEFYDSIDTVLMGRNTYETAVRLGENFAGKTVIVFSRKSEKLPSGSHTRFETDPVAVTKRLREDGKGIFLEGGGEIASIFLNET
jgi:dihydrofolate reductase